MFVRLKLYGTAFFSPEMIVLFSWIASIYSFSFLFYYYYHRQHHHQHWCVSVFVPSPLIITIYVLCLSLFCLIHISANTVCDALSSFSLHAYIQRCMMCAQLVPFMFCYLFFSLPFPFAFGQNLKWNTKHTHTPFEIERRPTTNSSEWKMKDLVENEIEKWTAWQNAAS